MISENKAEIVKRIFLDRDNPPICLAPMAHINDLAFRTQCRNHGVDITWTGMIHPGRWVTANENERKEIFQSNESDHPLICQLTGHDLKEFLQTAHDLEPLCDIIELDCYCYMELSRRDNFGYFLINTEEKRENTIEYIRSIVNDLRVPLSVKTRIIQDDDGNPSLDITLGFVKKLEEMGVSLIVFVGSTPNNEQTGNIDYEAISAVVKAVQIPVIANGGVKSVEDIEMQLSTGAAGVMIGTALLMNPWLLEQSDFNNRYEMFKEYIELYKKMPGMFYFAIKHAFYLFKEWIPKNMSARKLKTQIRDMIELERFVAKIQKEK